MFSEKRKMVGIEQRSKDIFMTISMFCGYLVYTAGLTLSPCLALNPNPERGGG